jgi:hypothetical protein
MLPFLNLFLLAAQFAYPTVQTLQVLRPDGAAASHIQWVIYWVLICLWLVVESWFSTIFDMIPLFGELKLVALAWLIHPEFEGATYLWFAVLKAPFAKLEAAVMAHLGGFLDKLDKKKTEEKFDKSSEAKQ